VPKHVNYYLKRTPKLVLNFTHRQTTSVNTRVPKNLDLQGYLHLKKERKTGAMNGEIRGRTKCGRTGRGKTGAWRTGRGKTKPTLGSGRMHERAGGAVGWLGYRIAIPYPGYRIIFNTPAALRRAPAHLNCFPMITQLLPMQPEL
jgi:hypothetical protein